MKANSIGSSNERAGIDMVAARAWMTGVIAKGKGGVGKDENAEFTVE